MVRLPRNAIYLLLFLTAVTVYLPSLRNGFIWDDEHYVVDNPTLRTLDGLRDIWVRPTATPQYYPLVHTTFWLEFHAWGLNPIGYHANNILLHAFSCVLLLAALRRMGVRGAEWAAILFAVHPVMVESVAWVTERKNVLSGMLTFLALLFAVDAWQLRPFVLAGPERTRWKSYIACSAFFIAALLSKTVACTFPLAVALLIYWRRGRIRKRELVLIIPLIAVGVLLGVTTAILEQYHTGAMGREFQLSCFQRAELAGRVVWFYATKLVWPRPLIFIYPRWVINVAHPLQWLPPIGVVVSVLVLFRARHRVGREALVLAALFVITLLPALGFVNVFPFRYSFVADHFQYMAAVVVFVAFGFIWSRWPRSFALPIGVAILALLAGMTWRRQAVFFDLRMLWTDTTRQNPDAWIAWNNLAMLDFDAGDAPLAAREFQRAVTIDADAPTLQANLGTALLATRDYPSASTILKRAVAQDANDEVAWYDLATAEAHLGDDAAAKSAYTRATQLVPSDVQPIADLAWLEATSKAIDVFDPADALALSDLAEEKSHGYSIRGMEARAAANAALGHLSDAKSDAERAAEMAEASGDAARAIENRRRSAAFKRLPTSRP